MKGAQAAILVWTLNAVVMLGGGLLGFKIYTERTTDLNDTFEKAENGKYKRNLIDWMKAAKTGDADVPSYGYRELSPRKRPPPVKVPDKTPDKPPVPDPEPTDEQLKADLEREVNAKFKLLRMMYSPDPEFAKVWVTAVDAGNAALIFRAGLSFAKEFGEVQDPKIKSLAAKDYVIKSIEKDHVLVDGPSIKRPSKRFTVKLNFGADVLGKKPDPKKFGSSRDATTSSGTIPQPPTPGPDAPPVAVEDTRPKQSNYDEKTDTWTIGTEDYMGVNTDDFVKYAKTVVDEKGQPIGIQVGDEIPDDNVIIKRGGKKGDIIKSINGVAVTNMSDVRRAVREQYNGGATEFEVLFERDGVPNRKMFKVPQKKKTGDGK